MRACEQLVPKPFRNDWHDAACLYIKAQAAQFIAKVQPLARGYRTVTVSLEMGFPSHGAIKNFGDVFIKAVPVEYNETCIATQVAKLEDRWKTQRPVLLLDEVEQLELAMLDEPERQTRLRDRFRELVNRQMREDIRREIDCRDRFQAFIIDVKTKRESIGSLLRQLQMQQRIWQEDTRHLDWLRIRRQAIWIVATLYEPTKSERDELGAIGVIIQRLNRQNVQEFAA